MNQETQPAVAADVAKTEVANTTSFHFKAIKELKKQEDAPAIVPVGKDEKGDNVFDADGQGLIAAGWRYTDKGWKRPSVEVVLPAVTDEDILSALSVGGQVKQFLLGITDDQFYEAARAKINNLLAENKFAVITADTIKGFGLTLEGIAAAYLEEAASAKATGIPKETWDEFVADYVAVMLRELPQNGEEKIKNAAEHLKRRFAACRSDKRMLAKLQSYLALWFAATSRQEEFSKLFKTLDDRATALLAVDEFDSI